MNGDAMCMCGCDYGDHYRTYAGSDGCSVCDCSGFEEASERCPECDAPDYEEDDECYACGYNPGGFECNGFTRTWIGEDTIREHFPCEGENMVDFSGDSCDDCMIVGGG